MFNIYFSLDGLLAVNTVSSTVYLSLTTISWYNLITSLMIFFQSDGALNSYTGLISISVSTDGSNIILSFSDFSDVTLILFLSSRIL